MRAARGVSPEALLLGDGSVRLYVTGGGPRNSIGVFRSADGLVFAQEEATVPERGFDPAIVSLPDGRLRMYYISAPTTAGRQLLSAVSGDGLRWTREPGLRLEDAGLGVPEVVPLSGGGWRLYRVGSPPRGDPCHCILSAVTTDGLSFTAEAGRRSPDDFVDPAVVQVGASEWLMIAAKFEGRTPPRSLFLATSRDGLSWTFEPEPFADLSPNVALDPTPIALGAGRYRVYYASGESDSNASIVRGILIVPRGP